MSEDAQIVVKTKKLGRKTYVYDPVLPSIAEKVAKEHSIDISNTKIEFALVSPMISNLVAGRCRLVCNEYTLLTEVNYLITFSKNFWDMLKPEQRELLMCHELMHIAKVKNKNGEFKRFALAGHTVEDFRYLITRYGVDWIAYVKATQTIIDTIQSDKEAQKLKKQLEKKQEKKLLQE